MEMVKGMELIVHQLALSLGEGVILYPECDRRNFSIIFVFFSIAIDHVCVLLNLKPVLAGQFLHAGSGSNDDANEI